MTKCVPLQYKGIHNATVDTLREQRVMSNDRKYKRDLQGNGRNSQKVKEQNSGKAYECKHQRSNRQQGHGKQVDGTFRRAFRCI